MLVNSEQLTVLIRNHQAGDEVTLALIRNGQPLKRQLKLGERQAAQTMIQKEALLADYNGILTFNVVTELRDAVDLSLARDVNDEEYVRRVYLDLSGTPPSQKDFDEFLSDDAPNKRQRLIDRLLSRPEVIARLGSSAVLQWSDGEHSLVLTTSEAGQKRLLAKDAQANVLYDGPVDAEEQRQQLGPRVTAKLDLMLKGLSASPPSAAAADATDALETILPRFQAVDETLSQLFERLRRETGANIVVDRRALAAAGVKLDEPLSFDLHDVRARSALKTLLALACGPTGRLTYDLEDGVVLITTAR